MTKIAIAGASGMLGGTLLPRFLQAGMKATLLSTKTRPGYVAVDYHNQAQVNQALSASAPEVIVNLAAATNVDKCEADLIGAFSANVKPAIAIGEWIRKFSPRTKFVHVSTDQVYNGTGPHVEESVVPINVYALTKYTAEAVTCATDSLILRTNFFGKSNVENRNSFTDWIFSELKKGNKIKAFQDILFSPLSMNTLCDSIIKLVAGNASGVYNLGAANGISKADFILKFCAVCGLDRDLVEVCDSHVLNLAAKRPKDMRMNSQKVMSSYGLKLPTIENEIESLKGDYQ
jgi:dTDP-4-dehydrorhamnose reductase